MTRRRDSIAAEAAFRVRLAELGAVLLEPEWLGTNHPHNVRCAAGHNCAPRPDKVLRGCGVCKQCRDLTVAGLVAARNAVRSAASAAGFRARLDELGAMLIEPDWLGNHEPHRVRCASGHECSPMPSNVLRGRGICRTCAGKDPAAAFASFLAELAKLGATLLEQEWLGSKTPHRVRCASDHACSPTPGSVQRGAGVCRVCARNDPVTARAAFRATLAAAGASLCEPAWLGATRPHQVICAAGHACCPTPNAVQRGRGICRTCAGKAWDVFYVVADRDAHRVKFGITSGNPQPRLRDHYVSGYRSVVRVIAALPGDTAPELERAAQSAVALAGLSPIRGREHYDVSALAVVLDVVDNYPMNLAAAAA